MPSLSRAAAKEPRFRAEQREPQYVVGIDLGTTNCAMCYVDLKRAEAREEENASRVETFLIPQAVAPDVAEALPTLPSFFARSAAAPDVDFHPDGPRVDFSVKARGPAKDGRFGVVGAFARDYGPAETDAYVASAKSWLCYSSVDRTAKILPLGADATLKWSPVEISSFYLRRLREVWNARFKDAPLEEQDVVVTIPASFDETARELTLAAAKLAGLPRVALVEEPQAAFYSWLERRETTWTRDVAPGDKILVCDVGGGTTDFALIYALERGATNGAHDAERKSVKFYRVAVGEHLLLGGDNLDLALERVLEEKAREKRGGELSDAERAALLKESRDAKEEFLSDPEKPQSRRVRLQGRGAKLISGGATLELSRAEVEATLVQGFFPDVPLDAKPRRRVAGLRELALPYASDPAITKHLALFLATNRTAEAELARAGVIPERPATSAPDVDPGRPDAVLFNGGVFESPILRDRIVDSLAKWFAPASDPTWRPKVLEGDSLYLAVARGAAYYGLVLRGLGSKIGASLARSYYAEVALDASANESPASKAKKSSRKGVCILHAQAEPGDEILQPRVFELEVDRPVAFPIFVSGARVSDAPGDLVELDPNETRELPAIRTALKTRSAAKKAAGRIKARLGARPTEIGTIELFLQEVAEKGRGSRWTLQFDARGGSQSDWEAQDSSGEEEGVQDESLVESALRVVEGVFGTDADIAAYNARVAEAARERGEAWEPLARIRQKDLSRKICEALGVGANEIPVATLRRLADRALELDEERKSNPALESRRLNWLGYALRPGFGASTDDWRAEQVWKIVGGRLAHGTPETRAQYWILWRRIASGLSSGRQLALAEPIAVSVRNFRRQLAEGRGKGSDVDLTSPEGVEIWRTLGAFELLPNELKEELGDAIVDVYRKKKTAGIRDPLMWTLGRLGARDLFHAPLDRTLAPEIAERWASRLLDDFRSRDEGASQTELFALAQLTARAEEKRFNVAPTIRDAAERYISGLGAEDSTYGSLERRKEEAAERVFGETLPLGLRWS